MGEWLDQWGEKPKRKVKPYWMTPGNIFKQTLSIAYIKHLTKWNNFTKWIFKYGFKCLPGAAGSQGMGCIGFPNHPVWEITSKCNLQCLHCHTSGGKTTHNELTTEEGKQLLDQLADVKEFQMMAFTGGEPLLRKDLFELLAYSKALGFSNTLATNAMLIDDSIAKRLRQYGVVIAAVSLDGFDAKTHDFVRNHPGAFDKAIEGIKALGRVGILLHINITAMEYNVSEVEKLMGLISELDTGILLMYQLVPVGRGRGIKQAALDLKANEKLIRFIVRAQKDAEAIIEPVAGPQYWALLLNQKGIDSGSLLRFGEKVFHGCAAGRGFIYIKPDGQVWPCPFIEINCGNVREQSFTAIWEKSQVLTDLRNRENLLKGQCGDCDYRTLCGGCRGRSWAVTGDYLAEDPSCFIHEK